MKRHDRVLEKIGRLKERYSGVASQYMIRIERTGDTATAVRFKRQDKAELADAAAGSCVLRTSHTDWDAEKILRTYWRLTDLENTLYGDFFVNRVFQCISFPRIRGHPNPTDESWSSVFKIRLQGSE